MTTTVAPPPRRPGCRAAVLLVTLAVLGLGCAGCHDDGTTGTTSTPDSSPAPTGGPVDPAFHARAEQVCRSADAQVRGSFPVPAFDPVHPHASQLPTVARLLSRSPLVTSLLPDLQALGEPAAGQPAWHTLVGQLTDLARITRTEIRDGEQRDTTGFAATARSAGGLAVEIVGVEETAGFDAASSCRTLVSG